MRPVMTAIGCSVGPPGQHDLCTLLRQSAEPVTPVAFFHQHGQRVRSINAPDGEPKCEHRQCWKRFEDHILKEQGTKHRTTQNDKNLQVKSWRINFRIMVRAKRCGLTRA